MNGCRITHGAWTIGKVEPIAKHKASQLEQIIRITISAISARPWVLAGGTVYLPIFLFNKEKLCFAHYHAFLSSQPIFEALFPVVGNGSCCFQADTGYCIKPTLALFSPLFFALPKTNGKNSVVRLIAGVSQNVAMQFEDYFQSASFWVLSFL